MIRRSYRCGAIHSRRARMAPDRIFLEQAGDAILVLELQGALFFGTGEKILSEVDVALRHETSCVILDLRRLTEIDSTGATALLELKRGLIQQKKRLLLAVSDRMAMERLESFGVLSSNGETNIFLTLTAPSSGRRTVFCMRNRNSTVTRFRWRRLGYSQSSIRWTWRQSSRTCNVLRTNRAT